MTVDVAVDVPRVDDGVGRARQVVADVTGVAGTATRLVGPGYARLRVVRIVEVAAQDEGARILRRDARGEVVTHLLHVAVAVVTQHAAVEHGATQTLHVGAGMALVAGFLQHIQTLGLVGDGAIRQLVWCRHWREQVAEAAVVAVHHIGVARMRQLVAAVGVGTRRSGHRSDLRQVQRRGVVTHLADHRLALHQRLVGQAVGVAVAAVGSDITRRRCTGGVDVVGTVLEVVQAQDVDVRRVLDTDVVRQRRRPGHPDWSPLADRQQAVHRSRIGSATVLYVDRIRVTVGAARLAGDRQHGVDRGRRSCCPAWPRRVPADRRSRDRSRRRPRTGCPPPSYQFTSAAT